MRLLVLAVVCAGCFKPAPQEGFACGRDNWCPDPLQCASDGKCRSGDPTGDGGIVVPPDVDLTGVNLAFVAVTPIKAQDLGPPPGSDAMCTQIANGAGHPGNFISWTSTATSTAVSRLMASNANGWVRVDGRPFAATRGSLIAGKILYPLRKDEHNIDHVVQVLTGTGPDGTFFGDTCVDFTSANSADLIVLGTSDGGPNRWTNDTEDSCDKSYAFFCLQVDHNKAIPAPNEQGPRAFITAARFTPGPGGGIAGADQLCQSEADAASLSGTYLAFLSTTQQSALSRFTLPPGPWIRVDGVATARDFTDWDAPIAVTAGGSYAIDDLVFSGATAPSAKSATALESCNDWTSSNGSCLAGEAAHTGVRAFGSSPCACGGHTILCLQSN
jgi:hypothetical protein